MYFTTTVNNDNVMPFSQLAPAIPLYVQLTVTGVFTALYLIIFVACYVQLWMLLCFGYTRRWHPFSLLWLALGWAGLRISLFSFYWPYFGLSPEYVSPQMSDNTSALSPILAYFLYAFPTCIQFFMLCVVASFVVGISSREFVHPIQTVFRLRCFLIAMSVIFLSASVIAVALQSFLFRTSGSPLWLTALRVLIQDVLFLLVSIFLVIFLRRVAKLPHISLILESLHTGRCGLLFTGSFLVLAFATRAIYDIIALCLRSIPSFNYGWIDLSDHAEISHLLGPNAAYAVFAAVLLCWDFLPTAVVLFLFRLRRPQVIRAPGNSNGVVLFWGDDNFDYANEDWTLPVTASLNPDDTEPLMTSVDEAAINSSPVDQTVGNESHGIVKFGVGSE